MKQHICLASSANASTRMGKSSGEYRKSAHSLSMPSLRIASLSLSLYSSNSLFIELSRSWDSFAGKCSFLIRLRVAQQRAHKQWKCSHLIDSPTQPCHCRTCWLTNIRFDYASIPLTPSTGHQFLDMEMRRKRKQIRTSSWGTPNSLFQNLHLFDILCLLLFLYKFPIDLLQMDRI